MWPIGLSTELNGDTADDVEALILSNPPSKTYCDELGVLEVVETLVTEAIDEVLVAMAGVELDTLFDVEDEDKRGILPLLVIEGTCAKMNPLLSI